MALGESRRPHLVLGAFKVDRDDERLWGPGGPVRLGNKAFLVLSRLIEAQGRLVTKDSLFSSVWDGTIVSEAALTSVVKELRRALGDDSRQPRYIQSVYGRGYRLLEEVLEEEEDEPSFTPAADPSGNDDAPRDRTTAYPPLLHVPAFDHEGLGGRYPWLGDLLREELLLVLSRFRNFRLVSDTAKTNEHSGSRPFGERDYQLGIRLLEDGNSISIFARIIRLENREIIWAERERLNPEKPGHDIELLIRKIAAAALPRVHDDVTHHLSARTEDAYGIYLQNKMAMRAADNLSEMKAVARKWEALLESHPGFAQAYAPLIYLYNTDFGYTGLGTTTDLERTRAYDLARKATKLDPSEPYLHTVSAWCHLWANEPASANEHLNEALELNPFQRNRLLEVATARMFLGDLDQAAELLARCESLTPFVTETPHEEAGLLHLLLGQNEKAIDCLRRVARPTQSSELYGLLAAGAGEAPDFTARVGAWAEKAQRHWQGSSEPDAATLSQWILYHHPFQQPARREWVLQLIGPALSSALLAQGRTLGPAPPQDWSEPSAAPARSSSPE